MFSTVAKHTKETYGTLGKTIKIHQTTGILVSTPLEKRNRSKEKRVQLQSNLELTKNKMRWKGLVIVLLGFMSIYSQVQVEPELPYCDGDELDSADEDANPTKRKRGLAGGPGPAPPSYILGEGGRPPQYGPLGG